MTDEIEDDESDRQLGTPRREELARQRATRKRTMDMLENVPSTHDVDRCVVVAVRRFLAARGIRTPGDIVDVSTHLPRDAAAAAIVDRIVEAVKESRFDAGNARTRNRVWVRLGLAPPMIPRSDHDELVR